MRKLLLAAAATLFMVSGARAGIDPFLGEVQLFPFDFCPKGWSPTDGRLLPINTNQALFSLLGTRYGGDGRTTFALPNRKALKTVNTVKVKECIAVQGIFPSRD